MTTIKKDKNMHELEKCSWKDSVKNDRDTECKNDAVLAFIYEGREYHICKKHIVQMLIEHQKLLDQIKELVEDKDLSGVWRASSWGYHNVKEGKFYWKD